MGFYSHGCEVRDEYRKLIRELLTFSGTQPCLKTHNGVPMEMGRAKEARVKKSLKTLRELGERFD